MSPFNQIVIACIAAVAFIAGASELRPKPPKPEPIKYCWKQTIPDFSMKHRATCPNPPQ